jgi:glycine/D-amino acid oxidase-like deaminating enzyme
MQVQYIIVGQGICGTFLSYYLSRKRIPFVVIDDAKKNTASKAASGVINPITGRRLVRTWMIEEVMPFAVNAYKNIEQQLNCKLIQQCNSIDFHTTPQMKLAFEDRLPQEQEYLSVVEYEDALKQYFNYHFGAGEINPCWLIDVNILLQEWRNKLTENNSLIEEHLNVEELKIENDKIGYQNIIASKIIFCEGIDGTNNPWFKLLPNAPNKGEALLVEITDLPRTNIYKNGISIVPWKDNLFWIGSSYEWSFSNNEPTEIFRKKTETILNNWLKLPYKIVEHIAAIRPANIERRPFVGMHPQHPQIGILNGMGTKGCSLAPYFANELVEHLINETPINPNADLQRFSKVLSR